MAILPQGGSPRHIQKGRLSQSHTPSPSQPAKEDSRPFLQSLLISLPPALTSCSSSLHQGHDNGSPQGLPFSPLPPRFPFSLCSLARLLCCRKQEKVIKADRIPYTASGFLAKRKMRGPSSVRWLTSTREKAGGFGVAGKRSLRELIVLPESTELKQV